MGQALKKPIQLDTQESFIHEANRLLHSYSYLVKGILKKGHIDAIDTMKQTSIHQQWNMIFPLLHPSEQKDKYNYTFNEYANTYNVWKYTGLQRTLEEPLLQNHSH